MKITEWTSGVGDVIALVVMWLVAVGLLTWCICARGTVAITLLMFGLSALLLSMCFTAGLAIDYLHRDNQHDGS